MSKYYNSNIPTEINFVYGGRHSGKTYYEFNKIKKENERLKEENKKLKEDYDILDKFDDKNIDDYKKLEEKNKTFEDYNKELNNQLDKLEERIDKAIEHIEESLYILKGDGDIPIATSNVRNRYIKPLLKILKGSEEK